MLLYKVWDSAIYRMIDGVSPFFMLFLHAVVTKKYLQIGKWGIKYVFKQEDKIINQLLRRKQRC